MTDDDSTRRISTAAIFCRTMPSVLSIFPFYVSGHFGIFLWSPDGKDLALDEGMLTAADGAAEKRGTGGLNKIWWWNSSIRNVLPTDRQRFGKWNYIRTETIFGSDMRTLFRSDGIKLWLEIHFGGISFDSDCVSVGSNPLFVCLNEYLG